MEEMDKTVATITTHVKKKSETSLTTTINKWIHILIEHRDLKTITTDLKKLKTALEDKNAEKVVTLIASLGEETTKAAAMAKGREGTTIKALEKALTTGSKTIAKFIK